MNVLVLPPHQRIFSEIGHVIEWWLRPKFKQQPADVGVEKTFGDVVRIFLVIHMFMMAAMFTRPHKHRILKRPGAANEREQSHR